MVLAFMWVSPGHKLDGEFSCHNKLIRHLRSPRDLGSPACSQEVTLGLREVEGVPRFHSWRGPILI